MSQHSRRNFRPARAVACPTAEGEGIVEVLGGLVDVAHGLGKETKYTVGGYRSHICSYDALGGL